MSLTFDIAAPLNIVLRNVLHSVTTNAILYKSIWKNPTLVMSDNGQLIKTYDKVLGPLYMIPLNRDGMDILFRPFSRG